MPDRDSATQQERNRRTLLIVRTSDGFPGRVREAARARGMSLREFVEAKLTPHLLPDSEEKKDDD